MATATNAPGTSRNKGTDRDVSHVQTVRQQGIGHHGNGGYNTFQAQVIINHCAIGCLK